MKLPAFNQLLENATRVFKRFPMVTITTLGATALAYLLMGEYIKDNGTENRLWTLLVSCNLLFASGLAIDLFAESRGYSNTRKWVLRIVVLACCGGIYTILDPTYYETDIIRCGLLVFACHQLVAFAPFLAQYDDLRFWIFNKTLFLRFFTALLYSATLYAGITLAIYGIQELFNLSVPSNLYQQLFVLIFVGFNTLFFLAGVPQIQPQAAHEHDYPKGLRVFAQYVLIPLMTVYLAILFIYELNILLSWQLPKGVVASLILGYAVFGTLALLLVWPLKDREKNRWVQLFTRFFYITLIPLILLLALAIYKRVANYGVTEERYILIALGIWLTGITTYFLLSKHPKIYIIPISLCVIALLGAFGPQSASSVAERSQQRRLTKRYSTTDAVERTAIINYLVRAHGLDALQPFTDTDMAAVDAQLQKTVNEHRYTLQTHKTDTAFTLLGITPEWGTPQGDYYYLSRASPGIVHVSDFDYSYRITSYQSVETTVRLQQLIMDVHIIDETRKIRATVGGDSVLFDLGALADSLYQQVKAGALMPDTAAGSDRNFICPPELLQIQATSARFRWQLVLDQLNGDLSPMAGNEPRRLNYEGQLLIGHKTR
ncbi:DUF4153 domain-containing protein [Parapedobacter lycopersici]|uniref:DUF4153 domain-containing protein n=1 Tax=Parapedobacter lycopersici TaxID=1864939 RepID=UPI00214DB283|nr:DUF4153 domain-containing protein [Parapedobacter lycopersici]